MGSPTPEVRPPAGELRRTVAAAVLYLAITLLLAYPLALNPRSSVMPGDPDTDLFMWTLAWNTHALTTDPLSVFDANIYYPHRNTLAFSENLLGSTLFAAPVLWTTGDTILALNVVSLSSIVLSALGAFVLARRLGLGLPAALLCGMAFAFSPPRFFRLGQLHLTTLQWVPFCLAFMHTYLDGGWRRDLRIALGLFSLQVLTSGHGAVFLLVALVCLLGYRFLLGEALGPGRRLRDVGVPGVLLLTPAVLMFAPYRYVQEAFGLRRSLEGWETPASSFFASPAPLHRLLFERLGVAFAEEPSAFLFPGFLIVILAVAAVVPSRRERRTLDAAAAWPRGWPRLAFSVSLVAILAALVAVWIHAFGPIRVRAGGAMLLSARDPWRAWVVASVAAAMRLALIRRVPLRPRARLDAFSAGWRRFGVRHRRSAVAVYGLLTVLGILLAAGPPFGLWPLVYDLPGFNFLRVPSRFMLLAVLGLSVLAAFGFERLTARFGGRGRAMAAAGVTAVLIAECLTIPLPGYRRYDVVIPPADRWLATQPGPLVIAELPTDHHDERRQSTYMLHSMAHWQKTIHGHSGIRTPLHLELYGKLRDFPSAASMDMLTELGVTHIVLHPRMYEPEDWAEASAVFPTVQDRLERVYDDGDSQVFRLRR
jgi:hypothetical protein